MFLLQMLAALASTGLFIAADATQSIGMSPQSPFYLLARGKLNDGSLTESYVTILKPEAGASYDSHALGIRSPTKAMTIPGMATCVVGNQTEDYVPQFRLTNGILSYSVNVMTNDSHSLPVDYSNAELKPDRPLTFNPGCGLGRTGYLSVEGAAGKFLSAGWSFGSSNWVVCNFDSEDRLKLGLKATESSTQANCHQVYLLATTRDPV